MDWYKDWTKNENEKKGKTFRRPVKAELPKVGGGDDKRLDTSYAFYIH